MFNLASARSTRATFWKWYIAHGWHGDCFSIAKAEELCPKIVYTVSLETRLCRVRWYWSVEDGRKTGDAGDRTRGLPHAKRTLYHWATSPVLSNPVVRLYWCLRLAASIDFLRLFPLSMFGWEQLTWNWKLTYRVLFYFRPVQLRSAAEIAQLGER